MEVFSTANNFAYRYRPALFWQCSYIFTAIHRQQDFERAFLTFQYVFALLKLKTVLSCINKFFHLTRFAEMLEPFLAAIG